MQDPWWCWTRVAALYTLRRSLADCLAFLDRVCLAVLTAVVVVWVVVVVEVVEELDDVAASWKQLGSVLLQALALT